MTDKIKPMFVALFKWIMNVLHTFATIQPTYWESWETLQCPLEFKMSFCSFGQSIDGEHHLNDWPTSELVKFAATELQCLHDGVKHLPYYLSKSENKAGMIRKNEKECWVEVGETGDGEARGQGCKTSIKHHTHPARATLSTLLLSGLVFEGPTSLQDVWCGSLDAGFLCIGRGLTAKWRPDTL